MGSAYAHHAIAAGIPTGGFDIDPAALERFVAAGGEPAGSPAQLATGCEIVLSALPSAEALEAAYFGPGGLHSTADSTLTVVEMSTLPIEIKEQARDRLAARGTIMLDAPVSGTGAQARERDLTIFASGDREAFDRSAGLMEAFARRVLYVGEFGIGSKLKFIANLLVAIHNVSAAEAIVLGEKAGIDPKLLFDAIAGSGGTSRMFEVRGRMMQAGAYDQTTMKVEVFAKDIAIISAFADSLGVPTPLFSTSSWYYTAALAEGRATEDTAAVAAVLRRMAGIM